MIRITTYRDVQQLLETGILNSNEKERQKRVIIPSARGVLMSVRKGEIS